MPPLKRKLRLLLADDHTMVRDGIRACLAVQPGLAIVGEAADGEEALRKARRCRPDVVLMDLNMPRTNGLLATAAMRREMPEIRVLVLTVHHEAEYVLELIRCGAHGYVVKDAPVAQLVQAIRAVGRGETFFSPAFTGNLPREKARTGRPARPDIFRVLSAREQEVLRLVVEGLGNKQIAAKLGLSVRTVETHRERLKHKLGIRTTVELVRFAMATGLVEGS